MKHLTLTAGVSAIVLAGTIAIPARAYEAGPVTGGGTIEGKVVFNGAGADAEDHPEQGRRGVRRPSRGAADRGRARQGRPERGRVPGRGGQGKSLAGRGTQVKTPELDNRKCRFEPDVQVIRAGPLVVVNDDPMLHNTHGYYGKRTAFNMALPNQGQRIPTELTRAGTVRIDCDAHGWMEGWIYVVDNPYYAITGADGKFTITDVPAGTYNLVAIQSLTGPDQQVRDCRGGQADKSDDRIEEAIGDLAGKSPAYAEICEVQESRSERSAKKKRSIERRCPMSELDRERREMAAVLQRPGVRPDPSLRITRRTFIHRSCLTGAATVAQTFAWWPLINTIDVAYAAEQPFKFAWVSDTHLYPKSVNTRFVEKVQRAAREVQAMNPPADFMIFGGDLAQLGRANELELGVEILNEVKIRKVFIPGEHDWYYDMGAKWRQLFDKPNWTFDHKGVRFIGLDTVTRGPDYWTVRKMSPEERMDHMATLDGSVAGPWAGVGRDQLDWVQKTLADWDKSRPVVIFSHNPLYEYYPPWNFWVRDWREVTRCSSLIPTSPISMVTSIRCSTTRSEPCGRSACWRRPGLGPMPRRACPSSPSR